MFVIYYFIMFDRAKRGGTRASGADVRAVENYQQMVNCRGGGIRNLTPVTDTFRAKMCRPPLLSSGQTLSSPLQERYN